MGNPLPRLKGRCSVPQDTLQGAPKGHRRVETLHKGAEPRQGHTWSPAWPRGKPRLQLDTGLAHWPLALTCQQCLASLSEHTQQPGRCLEGTA